jgi:heme oxygenase
MAAVRLAGAAVLTLRTRMREHTAQAHELLEATPLMRALAGGTPSVGEYRDYLARQFRLHAPFESALTTWVPPDWAKHRLVKAQWLRSDLLATGGGVDDRHVEVPAVASAADALGVLYVLEGGTLGMQAVRKRFQQDHPALNSGGRFMRGYGPDTSRFWRAFVDQLELLPTQAWRQATDAASGAFAAFHRLFQETGAAQPYMKSACALAAQECMH